jgi:hypothetical protein
VSTYLELVQQLVAELGIGGANNGGGTPSTVVGLSGQMYNAANWIKQAENNINVMWADWKYLTVDYSETLTVGSANAPAHSGAEVANQWDRTSFWLNQTATTSANLEFVDWREFRRIYLPGSAVASNSKPSTITIKRDGSLLLNNKSDDTYTLTAEFWQEPVLMSADADLPAMPSQYHRLIICEAAIKYGNKEAAGEVIQGMEAEYIYLLDKLEGDQLEGREYERRSTQDVPIEIGIPGFSDDVLRLR